MSEIQPEIKTETAPEPAAVAAVEEVVVSTELKNIIEALIFASDEPMTARFIRSIMDDVNKDLPPSGHFVVNAEIIRKAVGDLNRGYGRMGSGFRIIEIAGGFTYATQDNFSSWVGKLAKEKARRRLSPTAVETLAIIAYKQPIAKGEVEFIRGVNVDYIINALLEKDLIHITGRANTPGRPLLYGTTQKFLEHFGLNDLTDLPKPREISELINETELEVDRRLLAEQQELEFKEDLEKKLEGNEGSKNKPQKPAKIKVPEGIKEENRRGGRQESASDDKAADGQRSAEGVTPSESNLTTSEATAEASANVPENQAENSTTSGLVPLETGKAEDQEVLQDRSEENRGGHSVPPEEVMIGDEQDVPMTAGQGDLTTDARENLVSDEQVRSTTDDQENLVNEGQDRSAIAAPENRMSGEQDRLETVDSGNRVSEEQDRSASSGKEVTEIGQGNRYEAEEHHQAPEENLSPVSTDEEADHSARSTGGEQHVREAQPGNQQGSETGWSKWKNKVKTFFQKLFA